MLDKISWLHLSDFHFRAAGDSFSQRVSSDAILRDIPSRLSADFPVQFIVVTGDIAFSGQASEYEAASQFFGSLVAKLGIGLDRLCIAPGNHDVDRSRQKYMYEGVRSQLTNQQAVDEFLGQDSERAQLMERQAAFRQFRDQLSVECSQDGTHDGLARVRTLQLDGFRVCVLELNTAWLSGDKDQAGNLLIGERQIINALTVSENHRPHMTIALAHHPTDWLAEFDRLSCVNRLVPQLDVFHSGHLHWHQAFVMLAPGSQCLHSAAGSSHETRHYRNAYNLIEYDIGNAVYRIRQFEYRPDFGGFQEMEGIEYQIPFSRDCPAKADEIANALLETVPTSEPYANYMAALLTGDLEEVPIAMGPESVTFGSKTIRPEHQYREVPDFLRISNLLRIYDTMPINELISLHKPAVAEFVGLLSKTASKDAEFADMLANRETQAQKIVGVSVAEVTPYPVQYLEAVAQDGDLAELIEASTRYVRSSADPVRIAARRYLASALLQSDESSSRHEGSMRAFQNLDETWAGSEDYCVASAAAESFGDFKRAELTALRALEIWPDDFHLREYCRSLATQIGSQELSRRLGDTGGSGR